MRDSNNLLCHFLSTFLMQKLFNLRTDTITKLNLNTCSCTITKPTLYPKTSELFHSPYSFISLAIAIICQMAASVLSTANCGFSQSASSWRFDACQIDLAISAPSLHASFAKLRLMDHSEVVTLTVPLSSSLLVCLNFRGPSPMIHDLQRWKRRWVGQISVCGPAPGLPSRFWVNGLAFTSWPTSVFPKSRRRGSGRARAPRIGFAIAVRPRLTHPSMRSPAFPSYQERGISRARACTRCCCSFNRWLNPANLLFNHIAPLMKEPRRFLHAEQPRVWRSATCRSLQNEDIQRFMGHHCYPRCANTGYLRVTE